MRVHVLIGGVMLAETLAQECATEFAVDVRLGLTKKGQKEIPSKYLYDEVGSALFEVRRFSNNSFHAYGAT